MEIALTHLGTATVLLEIGSLRLLTDPALDPAGGRYRFGFGTGSTKTRSAAVPPSSLEGIDAVLLSHDQHADNLDTAGRTFLRTVPHVLTTRAAARRLGPPALGRSPGESSSLRSSEGLEVRVTATPARHGPPASLPLVGHVIGFLLEWEGQAHGALYISGDTVRHAAMEQIGRRTRVGTALMHLGAVRFGISGPLRYTMGAADAARVALDWKLRTLVPIHYEGWTHFREPRAEAERAFADAGLGSGSGSHVEWLSYGTRTAIEV